MDPQEVERIVRELEATTQTIQELRGQVKEAIDGLDTRVAAALEEQLKPHTTRQEELQTQLAEAKAQAADAQTQAAAAQTRADEAAVAAMRPPLTNADPAAEQSEEQRIARTGGFDSLGEFVRTIRFEGGDGRLAPLRERALSMGVGAGGGFLVPPQFVEMLAAIQPQDAIVRPRAQVIPAGDSPDATVTIPADDQGGTKGVFSGVNVVWTGEAATKTETEPAVRQIELSPKEVSGYTVLSDKLIRNAAAAGPYVESKLRQAILAAEDVAFITGSGVGQPLGFLGHTSAVNVARAVAAQIAYADVVGMYSRLLIRQGTPVWIGNPTVLPQLMTMEDTAGHLIWTPSAREGEPPTLTGFPFLRNERQPVLGTAGDLMLVDLSFYVIKDGAAMVIDVSQHVKFLQNQSVIRVVWNVDGQPTLSSPLLLEDGSTTQSPFVVLHDA